jgi:hypothetical protein
MTKKTLALLLLVMVSVWTLGPRGDARAQTTGEPPAEAVECSSEELTAKVPELEALHEVVAQLWHDAYPEKNYKLIKELMPDADDRVAKLDAAELPGILRDKQAKWDEGKGKLKGSLASLHAAVDANDEPAMLKETEAFHAAFEGLVRVIRPVTPEFDAFHQELYKLYHYAAPQYDLPAIRAQAKAMQEKIPPLAVSKLPKRVADRQEKFDAAVKTLSATVDDLVKTAEKDSKDAILAAVEAVHMAYLQAEKVFE